MLAAHLEFSPDVLAAFGLLAYVMWPVNWSPLMAPPKESLGMGRTPSTAGATLAPGEVSAHALMGCWC